MDEIEESTQSVELVNYVSRLESRISYLEKRLSALEQQKLLTLDDCWNEFNRRMAFAMKERGIRL